MSNGSFEAAQSTKRKKRLLKIAIVWIWKRRKQQIWREHQVNQPVNYLVKAMRAHSSECYPFKCMRWLKCMLRAREFAYPIRKMKKNKEHEYQSASVIFFHHTVLLFHTIQLTNATAKQKDSEICVWQRARTRFDTHLPSIWFCCMAKRVLSANVCEMSSFAQFFKNIPTLFCAVVVSCLFFFQIIVIKEKRITKQHLSLWWLLLFLLVVGMLHHIFASYYTFAACTITFQNEKQQNTKRN